MQTPVCLGLMLACLLSGAVAAAAAEAPESGRFTYAVTAHWAVGGAGAWDYLAFDQQRHRLFIAHGNRVDVIDSESGRSVGQIAQTPGVHGIALAPSLQRGYTSNGRSDSVTAFDLVSLRPLQTVKVSGGNPDAIYYDEPTARVFTFNGKGANATVLDARTLKIVGTVKLAGKPEFMAGDGRGHVYVNIETAPGQLQAIDTRSLTVVATWGMPGCPNPTGIAIDTPHRRLFSACENSRMVVTNVDTGRQVASVSIGGDPDAVAFDPALGLAFVSNGASGTLSVVREVDADHFRPLADTPTQLSARTMALDPASHRIYLAAAIPVDGPAATADAEPRFVPDSFEILVAEPRSSVLTPARIAPDSPPKPR